MVEAEAAAVFTAEAVAAESPTAVDAGNLCFITA
jgi:hypothetical protein